MNKLVWMALAAWLLSGCGEISYKRGATPADLEVARKACRASGDDKAADKCLEDQGWVIRKPDDMDLFASVAPSNDARIPAADGAKPPAAVVTASAGAAVQPGAAQPVPGQTAPAVAAPAPPLTPLDVYTVGSWWKIGAGRESLEADMSACVKDLGDAHRPDAATRLVTRGLVVCLHDKGWKALLDK